MILIKTPRFRYRWRDEKQTQIYIFSFWSNVTEVGNALIAWWQQKINNSFVWNRFIRYKQCLLVMWALLFIFYLTIRRKNISVILYIQYLWTILSNFNTGLKTSHTKNISCMKRVLFHCDEQNMFYNVGMIIRFFISCAIF